MELPYSVDWEGVRAKLRELGARRVLVQLPDGLKMYFREVEKHLGDYELIFQGDPCFGACDVPLSLWTLRPDVILQFGHSPMPNLDYGSRVLFVEVLSEASVERALNSYLLISREEKVGLLATAQHIHLLETAKEWLESAGIEAVIGEGDHRLAYPGQVLGCDFSAARSVAKDVEAFLVLSSGRFHAVGVYLSTGKRTYALDPISGSVEDVSDYGERLLRQRFGAIAKAEEADEFGILVGLKPGQTRIRLALYCLEVIKSAGKRGYLISADILSGQTLRAFDVDVYVNTACPRIAIEDWRLFHKPVITPIELEMALKLRRWEDYAMDEIWRSDGIGKFG